GGASSLARGIMKEDRTLRGPPAGIVDQAIQFQRFRQGTILGAYTHLVGAQGDNVQCFVGVPECQRGGRREREPELVEPDEVKVEVDRVIIGPWDTREVQLR